MAFATQEAQVELMNALTGLTHDIFIGDVVNNVRRESPTAMCFQEAGDGDYRLEGQNLIFAVDLHFKNGALATSGKIPNHQGLDAVQGKVTPIRRYMRIALDNFVEQRAKGPGAFEDIGQRIFDKAWDSWKNMWIRHSIGDSSGLVCKVASRTSSTVFAVKDGYGNTGTNPVQHLDVGSVICWYDVSESAVGGAAKIADIDYTTNTLTVDSGTTWEAGGNNIAADDLIFFSTTNNIADDHFEAEKDLAPNGVGVIVDPLAKYSTVFNISQSDHPRWKPFRQDSTTFDHIELTEHWIALGAKRGFEVNPMTDKAITHPVCMAQLARSLMAFQQQAYTGEQLRGGYNIRAASGQEYEPHAGLVVSGIGIYADQHFYHDALVTLFTERMYYVNLGADPDWWAGDGSMWDRIPNYDGKDAYVPEYMQTFSNHRGAHGALTSITTELTADDFTGVPDY